MKCEICHHNCDISENGYGFCGARKNQGGAIVCDNYGKITSLALDPIEKKPLYHFFPGSRILSVGSYGCNMKCGFCQNFEISQRKPRFDYISPEKLVKIALNESENCGVAFTYNEPTISFEYVADCAKLLKQANLKVVLVSNGQVNKTPLEQLAPLVDAWNIDVKAWNADFYRRHGGDFEAAKRAVELASKTAHVEATTLIIPGENDSDDEIAALAKWLARLSPETPYHLSRYFPRYKYDAPPTPADLLFRLAKVAKRYLRYVYVGNV
ncbi:AmmeMemoRadiSam system radical SAM enzyme [Synergistales bacterium]|nr:AmmeMemoRadiSam system radical SAM enzyme [Synergistales bacterium]